LGLALFIRIAERLNSVVQQRKYVIETWHGIVKAMKAKKPMKAMKAMKAKK
jgi:hypothetical protein